MDITDLRIILKFGKIFGFPLNTDGTSTFSNRKQRGYLLGFGVFTLIAMTGVTIELTELNWSVAEIVVALANDLSLYLLTFYVIIVLTFFKQPAWCILVRNLNTTSGLVQGNRLHYVVFYIVNVLYILTDLPIVYKACEGHSYFIPIYYIMSHSQFYLEFYCITLLYVLTGMLTTRYQSLKRLLQREAKQDILFLQRTQSTMLLLKKTVDLYQKVFAPLIFFSFSYRFVSILSYEQWIFFYPDEDFIVKIVISTDVFFWSLLTTSALTINHYVMIKETLEIRKASLDLFWRLKNTSDIPNHVLNEFGDFMSMMSPTLTAANFFKLQKQNILELLYSVLTFLVVFMQLLD